MGPGVRSLFSPAQTRERTVGGAFEFSKVCPRFRCRHPFRTKSVAARPLEPRPRSDATLIRVEADNGLTGIGAAFGAPPIVEAIVEHELPAECAGENPMFSERI